MIITNSYERNLYGHSGTNTSYFGESALKANISIREKIAKYLYKSCITDDGYEGIIIGLEDNTQYCDYYYIVYVPKLDKVVYQLCNDANFVKTIKV